MSINSYEAVKIGIENCFGYAGQLAQQEVGNISAGMSRPFVLLKPRIFVDENKWCALYGDNLQDGVAGFGDTPDKASRDFDQHWLKDKAWPLGEK